MKQAAPVALPRYPALRDSVMAFRAADDEIQFLLTADLKVKTFSADPFVFALVPLLDGRRSRTALAAALAGVDGDAADRVDEVLAVLRDEGLLSPRDGGWRTSDIPDGMQRYDRQLRLFADLAGNPEIDLPADPVAVQDRFRTARVGVVGAGGSGTWALVALAAAGVGRLRVVDHDTVAESNLNRQVVFGPDDVGQPKVAAAARRLRSFNPGVTIEPVEAEVACQEDLPAIVAGCDVVVNCADRPSVTVTSDWIAEACHPEGIPHVVAGAYALHLGILGLTVLPGRTTCWRCVRKATADDHGRGSATPLRGAPEVGGSLAVFSAVIGNLLAWECLRVLAGIPPMLADQLCELDLLNLDLRRRAVVPRADCDRCPATKGS